MLSLFPDIYLLALMFLADFPNRATMFTRCLVPDHALQDTVWVNSSRRSTPDLLCEGKHAPKVESAGLAYVICSGAKIADVEVAYINDSDE